jgi:hypothetical protein
MMSVRVRRSTRLFGLNKTTALPILVSRRDMVLFDIPTDMMGFVAEKCAFARQEVERAQTSTCIGNGDERDGVNHCVRHVHTNLRRWYFPTE